VFVERPKTEALGYLEAMAEAKQQQRRKQAAAKTEADPCGMTNKGTGNGRSMATAKTEADPCGMTNKGTGNDRSKETGNCSD
jgi:hypothetical protein